MKNLHELPRFADKLSYLYVEHAVIEQADKAIAIHDADGVTPVPAAALAVLVLGPGTSITHAAVRALADNNCQIVWSGEQGVRFAFPTHVGVNRYPRLGVSTVSGVPHARGGEPLHLCGTVRGIGCSPRTWG